MWLFEGAVCKYSSVAVARTIVQPTSTTLPVSVLNVRDEPIIVYAGSVLATMSQINPPTEVAAVGDQEVCKVSEEKQQMLWQLVQESVSELSKGEREVFYELLLTHADVLASSTVDLGMTDKLRRHIDTGASLPIRQPVCRIYAYQ